MIQSHKQISQRWSLNKVLLTILFPFLGLLQSLSNWRKPWAKNIFWLVCMYMGFIQIYQPEGTILGVGADGGRYALNLIEMHKLDNWSEVVENLFYEWTIDFYQPVSTFIISRFTDNGHILFLFFAAVFGYFYSRNIWYILNRLPSKFNKSLFILVAFFILVCPIWQINGVRMWTALHIFVYGAIPYLLEGKKNSLLWCYLSLFVHFSFLFPCALITVFLLAPHKTLKSNTIINLALVFYLLTMFVSELNVSAFGELLLNYLPGMYESKIDTYTKDIVVEGFMESKTQWAWHVVLANNISKWMIRLLTILIYLNINKNDKDYSHIKLWFVFSLLLSGLANILANVPSGGRFMSLGMMFMVPIILIVMTSIKSGVLKKHSSFLMVLLLPSIIFNIRTGLDYYSIMLIIGNFITAIFIEIDVPLINYIKNI